MSDKRNASQKISDLEKAVSSLYQTANDMARDLTTIKEAIKLLGNKVDSIVKASTNGEAVNDAVISRIMIENNCEELANKVKGMVAQGILAPADQVNADSFIVGSELNEQGETANPRLQFALYALQNPEIRAKFDKAKVGDLLNLEEGKLKFLVGEIYQIQKPSENADEAVEAQGNPNLPEQGPPNAVTEAPPQPAESVSASV